MHYAMPHNAMHNTLQLCIAELSSISNALRYQEVVLYITNLPHGRFCGSEKSLCGGTLGLNKLSNNAINNA